jgi:hypothetical protein
MLQGSSKWTIDELSQAMATAIFQCASPRFLKQNGDIVKFNGFWRDGDKQNVCAWLNKGTWHDIKTGQGGGCKEFAKVAFNLNLPEFMERYGYLSLQKASLEEKAIYNKQSIEKIAPLKIPIDKIFQNLLKKDNAHDQASSWLINERSFNDPKFYIGSGYTNLDDSSVCLFEEQHQAFIRQRLKIANQIVVPLRGPHSCEVKNLFFRSISTCSKEDKSRLLPNVGGWHEPDGAPRAFGFPHLINDFPNFILCEGMADYFTAELLFDCEHRFLPIGVASASALPKWADWLIENKFAGNVIVIFHLDQDGHGNLSDSGVGQDNAIKCVNHLTSAGIGAKLFSWLKFLKRLNNFTEVRDLADTLKTKLELNHLQKIFLQTILEDTNA